MLEAAEPTSSATAPPTTSATPPPQTDSPAGEASSAAQPEEAAATEASEAAAPEETVVTHAPKAVLVPEAGDLAYAQLWYYRDDAGMQQGPFDSASMRAWYDAGYLPDATKACPSYYGEVPAHMWPLNELYAEPKAEAFILASDALVVPAVEVVAPEYLPSDQFAGAREGYAFKNDLYGIGYYKDMVPVPSVSFESLEEEKRVKRVRYDEAQKRSGNAMPRFDAISS